MSDDVVGMISHLINEKRWDEAVALGAEYASDPRVTNSAHFWFAYGLARELTGGDGEGEFEEACRCEDFTLQMQGDMYRDLALGLARQRRFDSAYDLLFEAREIFRGDTNRLASVDMFVGRVEYLRGQLRRAEESHWLADASWRALGDAADPQWVMNNRFYWLKVQATLGLPTLRLYREFLHSPEPRKDRRKLARLYFQYGPAGVIMGNTLEMAAPRAKKLSSVLDLGRSNLAVFFGRSAG